MTDLSLKLSMPGQLVARVLPYLPGSIAGAGGLVVTVSGGVYTVAPQSGSIATTATANTWTALQTFNSGPAVANTTSQFNVATYDGSTVSGKAAVQIGNTDNGAQTALEKYSAWISAYNQGTGDGTPAATTFPLGLSAIKTNWTTTTVPGEFVGLNIAARGGHNNALVSGDTAALTTNVAVSFSNNFAASYEGVTNYFPGGSTVSGSVLSMNTQVGTILASTVSGTNGFYAQAQNGQLGVAFSASNLGTNGTAKYGTASNWNAFLQYLYDDGVHTPYIAFLVDKVGQFTFAGQGAVNTNQKTFRVGGSVANNLEILNAAKNAVILSLTDTGDATAAAHLATGQSGVGYATGAGGTITQITSRTTGVTLNKITGAITLFSEVTPPLNTIRTFTVTNSSVAAADTVLVSVKSASNTYASYVTAVAAGSFAITVQNIVGTATDGPVLNFAVIKAATS